MLRSAILTTAILICVGACCALAGPGDPGGDPPGPVKLFFLHHSTGRYLLAEGGARAHLDAINLAQFSSYALWDHDYNAIGLMDPAGQLLGYGFDIPDDNTDPVGLHQLWTTPNAARDSILANYDVIAFKSCYPASDIAGEAMLEQYKAWYLEIRDVLDLFPQKRFVVMSQPPLHRLATDPVTADRARAFADWLAGPDFLGGRSHISCFDFFDLLAQADDGSATRNMLRWEFEHSHTLDDSHPNALANQTVGPLFIDFLVVAGSDLAASAPVPAATGVTLRTHPNPFNPATRISFELDTGGPVRLQVLTVRGELVRELLGGELGAGPHGVDWNGRDTAGLRVGSGTYLLRLETRAGVAGGKLLLAK